MIQRQWRDHHLLAFADHRVTLGVELLHARPHLLHVGHQVAVGQHGALGHTRGAAGVLQHSDVIQAERRRLQAVARAVAQQVLEGDGLRQAVVGHHLLQMLDRRIDQRPAQRRQHVADLHLDQVLDRGVGQHLLHVVAERIEVHQRPRAGILKLVAHLPRGIQRVGVDHDEPRTQRAEHRDRVLQQVGHLDGDAITRLQIGVVLQPGGERGGVTFQIGIAEGHAHVAERRAVGVRLAGALEHFHDRAIGSEIDVVGHAGRAFVIPEFRLHCYWPLYLRVSGPRTAGSGELSRSASRRNSPSRINHRCESSSRHHAVRRRDKRSPCL